MTTFSGSSFDSHLGLVFSNCVGFRRAGRRRTPAFYDRSFRGKTSAGEDRVKVRFIQLVPPRRIVEAVGFVTTDPSLLGEMTIVVTFKEVAGGTEVTFLCDDLPPGLRPEDNEAGSRLSWSNWRATSSRLSRA